MAVHHKRHPGRAAGARTPPPPISGFPNPTGRVCGRQRGFSGCQWLVAGLLWVCMFGAISTYAVEEFPTAAEDVAALVAAAAENPGLLGPLSPHLTGAANPCATASASDITCDNSNPFRVTEIRLFGAPGGRLPPSLAKLSKLRVLTLPFNNLAGPIPAAFATMPSLKELYLHGNLLSGPLSPAFATNTQLTTLYLAQNRLSSAVPTGFRSNVLLSLTSNCFASCGYNATVCGEQIADGTCRQPGEVTAPSDIVALEAFRDLHYQLLTSGVWPANTDPCSYPWQGVTCSPGTPGYVTRLAFSGAVTTLLQGPLSPALGNLSRLQYLDLSFTNAEGKLVKELARAQNLEEIHLRNNNLEGVIDPVFGTMPKLRFLGLSNNFLEGPLPNLGSISVDIDSNCFDTETCPQCGYQTPLKCWRRRGDTTDPQDLEAMLALRAKSPSLGFAWPYGQDPCLYPWQGVECGAGNPHRITGLRLSGMALNWVLSDVPLGSLPELRTLYLSSTGLTSQLPPALATQLPKLKSLVLDGNNLTGTISPLFVQLPWLTFFSVIGNYFEDPAPPPRANITFYYLSNNCFRDCTFCGPQDLSRCASRPPGSPPSTPTSPPVTPQTPRSPPISPSPIPPPSSTPRSPALPGPTPPSSLRPPLSPPPRRPPPAIPRSPPTTIPPPKSTLRPPPPRRQPPSPTPRKPPSPPPKPLTRPPSTPTNRPRPPPPRTPPSAPRTPPLPRPPPPSTKTPPSSPTQRRPPPPSPKTPPKTGRPPPPTLRPPSRSPSTPFPAPVSRPPTVSRPPPPRIPPSTRRNPPPS